MEMSKIKKSESRARVTVTGRRCEISVDTDSPRKLRETPVFPEIKPENHSK